MTAPVGYDERLVAPPLWWVGAGALSLLIAAGLHGGAGGARAVVPYVVVPPLVLGALGLLSRGRVRVEDDVLHVPGARIPLHHLGAAVPLDREGTRRARGPLADPSGFVVTRPWLPGAVQVPLTDPADDTPYWLVGTRDPQRLAAALTSGGRAPRS